MASNKKAVVVSAQKIEIQDAKVEDPKEGEVLVKVLACGICHSDVYTYGGHFPGLQLPRVPGHEVCGEVVKVGAGVERFKVGDIVARGWHGSHCFQCKRCVQGDFIKCDKMMVTGIHTDGGYQEFMLSNWQSLIKVPKDMSPVDAAPLVCAGVTVFNSLRNLKLMPPAVVVVQGIGGLGHLAIQFANKMGYKTVAVSTSPDKKELALKLGAHHYFNSKENDVVKEIQKLGGAGAILATVYEAKAMAEILPALGIDGTLLVLGAPHTPVEVQQLHLLSNRAAIKGWPSGRAVDSEETLEFASYTGIRPMVETFPLEKANEALQYSLTNKARFRVVLDMNKKE